MFDPLERRNVYSDPYQGSYHRCFLTEPQILSSSHYRRMTSAQRHGSNYIIQAHNTPAAEQHQTQSAIPPLSFLSPLPPSLLFIFYLLLFCLSGSPRFVLCSSANTDKHCLQSIQPLALMVESFKTDYNLT